MGVITPTDAYQLTHRQARVRRFPSLSSRIEFNIWRKIGHIFLKGSKEILTRYEEWHIPFFKETLISTQLRAVILSYNHPHVTAQCVESALRLNLPVHLVHNGSEPRHVRFLKESYPTVDHIVLPNNKGFSGGANVGIREALKHSSWILFLTNDCQLIQQPSLPSQAGIYGPHLLRKDKTRTESVGGRLDLQTGRLHHVKNLSEWRRSKRFLPYVSGHAFLIHRQPFEMLNGFDESLHTYWEDVDFSARLQATQGHVGYLEDFVVSHSGGKTCRKDRTYSGYFYRRNCRIVVGRYSCTPWRARWFWTKDQIISIMKSCLNGDLQGLQFQLLIWKELIGLEVQLPVKKQH